MTTLRIAVLEIAVLALGILFLSSAVAEAAFIIEPNGKGGSNFSAPSGFTGSSVAAGINTNLPALGLTPGTLAIYGGSEYRFDYTPGNDGDNTIFSAGDQRNQFAQFISSGMSASASNRFRVFQVHPESNNITGGPTNYEIFVNDLPTGITQSADQNLDINDPVAVQAALDTGSNIGLWELIGEVTLSSPNDKITVVQKPTATTFVSMRSGGILFEAIPEPTTGILLAASVMTMAATRWQSRLKLCRLKL